MGARDVLSHLPGGRSARARAAGTTAPTGAAVAAHAPPRREAPSPAESMPATTADTAANSARDPGRAPVPASSPGDQPDEQPRGRDGGTTSDSGATAIGAGHKVVVVHRIGAVVVAAVIAVFGLLGFLGGLAFFSTSGEEVVGLSSNGLLSTISVLTAAVLVVAAVRGGRTASTVMFGIGALFLLSAMWHLVVLNTSINFLAFSMANVVFSIVTGIVLLTLGAYGRVSGNIPRDNPYYVESHTDDAATGEEEPPEVPAVTRAEKRAERDMRAAELAVMEHRATPEQQRRVEAMSRVRTKVERREVWMSHR